jgi:hypothetical protein
MSEKNCSRGALYSLYNIYLLYFSLNKKPKLGS